METAVLEIIASCAIIVVGAILTGALEKHEEIGLYTMALGMILVALAVFHFPWVALFKLFGFVEFPEPDRVSLVGASVAFCLLSLFAGLHLSDLVDQWRSKIKGDNDD